MLPKTWLEYLQCEEVDMEITVNLFNATRTPKYFFVEKDFESWNTQIHGPHNYLQNFYVGDIIDEYGTNEHYPLETIINGKTNKTRKSYKYKMSDGTSLSSSDSGMASKIKKKL